jgi:hypothetical protein
MDEWHMGEYQTITYSIPQIEVKPGGKFLNLTSEKIERLEGFKVEDYKYDPKGKTFEEKYIEIKKIIEKAKDYSGIILPQTFDTESLLIFASFNPEIYILYSKEKEIRKFELGKLVSFYAVKSEITKNIYILPSAHSFDIFGRMFYYDNKEKVFGLHPIFELPASIQVPYKYAELLRRTSKYISYLFPSECKMKYIGVLSKKELDTLDKNKIIQIDEKKLSKLFEEKLGLTSYKANIVIGSFANKEEAYKKYINYIKEKLYKEIPDKKELPIPYPETYEEYVQLSKKLKYNCKEIEKEILEKAI